LRAIDISNAGGVVLPGPDALGALRQHLAWVEVLEQAERVFHVDAHRGGQPAHVAQDSQDAKEREVAEQLERRRAAAKADLSRSSRLPLARVAGRP
jgi:hypothetical protein